jgi:HSP20 family protein
MFGLTPFNRSTVRRTSDQDPFANFIDDFFSDGFEGFFPTRNLRHDTFKIDVKEEDNAYIIEADLPGVRKEEIQLNYQEGCLSISVERSETKEEDTKNYIHRERRQSTMRRRINLGDLDPDQIDAKLEDGILTVTAPKTAIIDKTKRIEIK